MDSKNGGKVEHLQRLLSEARDEKNESNHLLEQLKKKLKNQEELNRLQSEEKNNTIDALYSEVQIIAIAQILLRSTEYLVETNDWEREYE